MKKLFSVPLFGAALLLTACASNKQMTDQELDQISVRYINAAPDQILSAAKNMFDQEFPDGYNYGTGPDSITVIHPHTTSGILTGRTGSNFRRVYVQPTLNGQTYVKLQASDLNAGAPGQSVLTNGSEEWTNVNGVQASPEYYEQFFQQLETGLGTQRDAPVQ